MATLWLLLPTDPATRYFHEKSLPTHDSVGTASSSQTFVPEDIHKISIIIKYAST